MALNVCDLFLNDEDSDMIVRLFSEDDQDVFEVPGHKMVIRRASTVFQKMLQTDFKESKSKVVELKTKGNRSDAMTFLRYIYTKNLDLQDWSTYIALMHTAHLYSVNDLFELCEKGLQEVVTPYIVCKAYLALEDLASSALLTWLFNLMLKSAFLIFRSKFHLLLKEETMKLMLQSDQLNVSSEEQAVEALWTWGQAKCSFENKAGKENIKNEISELLPLIRWKLIGNVTQNETWSCLMDTNNDNAAQSNACRENKQSESLRRFCKILNLGLVLNFSNYELLGNKNPLISFSVSTAVSLKGCNLYVELGRGDTAECLEPGSIFFDNRHIPNSNVVWNYSKFGKGGNSSNSCSWIFRVEFKTPVLIRNSGIHDISLELGFLLSSVYVPVYRTSDHSAKMFQDSCFEINGVVRAIQQLYYIDM